MILRKRAEEIMDLVEKTEKKFYLQMISSWVISILAQVKQMQSGKLQKLRKTYRTPTLEFISYFQRKCGLMTMEQLDKGLIDFGIMLGPVDLTKYNALKMKNKDIW